MNIDLRKLDAFVGKLDRRLGVRPTLTRWVLAGPLGFILSILSLTGLPHLLPVGAGGVNHLLLPVILFPVLWTIYIVWPVMTERLGLCTLCFITLFAVLTVTLIVGIFA
ncbi:MAG: hypothetical protein ABJ327_07205 [Litoreibacter sp.]